MSHFVCSPIQSIHLINPFFFFYIATQPLVDLFLYSCMYICIFGVLNSWLYNDMLIFLSMSFQDGVHHLITFEANLLIFFSKPIAHSIFESGSPLPPFLLLPLPPFPPAGMPGDIAFSSPLVENHFASGRIAMVISESRQRIC